MNKIIWCTKNKNGLTLIEPNSNLSKAYIKKAEEALQSMRINTIKDWEISTAYYTVYFSLYCLLVKIGIKCEIHSCTIEFVKKFLNTYFDKFELKFIESSLKARIDSQYYIDRTVSDEQYKMMLDKAPLFLVKCKSLLNKLTQERINKIRTKFKEDINLK